MKSYQISDKPPRGQQWAVMRYGQVIGGGIVVEPGRYDSLKEAETARGYIDPRLVPLVIPVDKPKGA
jgi:hypothetical protein